MEEIYDKLEDLKILIEEENISPEETLELISQLMDKVEDSIRDEYLDLNNDEDY